MTRILPSAGSTVDLEQLEDHEPYGVTLKAFDWSTGSAEYGSEQRLQVDWDLGTGESLRDWISLRLGKQQNGTIAKLRQLLNALSDKPADAEIAWFDTETTEWGYEKDGPAYNKLSLGMEVVIRGLKGTRQDGGGKFSIQVYQAPKKARKAGLQKANVEETTPLGQTRGAKSSDEEPPF